MDNMKYVPCRGAQTKFEKGHQFSQRKKNKETKENYTKYEIV